MTTSSAISGMTARPARRVARVVATTLPYLISFGVLLLAWYGAAEYIVRSALFPSPFAVMRKAVELIADGSLLENAAASITRVAIGFAFGSSVGIPTGLLIGNFRIARALVEPWTEFLRFIPATAMITIVVIWFGIGEESKIFLIAYSTVFSVTLNTAAGVSSIAPNKLWAARSLGANQRQIFFLVSLPATVPFILTGMRLAMANSFTSIIAAELIAAQQGLGVMIWNARMFMLVDQIFVALLTVGLAGLCADRLFRLGIYRFAGRYSPVT